MARRKLTVRDAGEILEHWQAGQGIRAIARTNDGLIEAIEYDDPENMPFFMGVQWHPERMDIDNPFSLPIALAFVQEAKLYRAGHQFAE